MSNKLPSGYTELYYIEATGTQYIDTGFKHNQDTRVVMKVLPSTQSANAWLFEGRNTSSSTRHGAFFYYSSTKTWNADFDGTGVRYSFSDIGTTDMLEIDYNKNICVINDSTHTFTYTTFQSNYNLCLMACNTKGTIAGYAKGRLYYCTIYDNGTLIRQYIPCIDNAGNVGLYDLVDDAFYANAGTGDFVPSAPVPTGTTAIQVKYNDSVIHTATDSEAFTLKTRDKFMAGNVTIGPKEPDPILENNSWADISEVAQAGEGGNYWSVGDTKSVLLSGTVGTLSINTTLYAYIIGINHRSVNGITFQGFKTAQNDGTSVALVDGHYGSNSSTGALWFNLNHWGNASASPYNTNYGGWKGCDARYDILGSTNVAPSGYGTTPTTSRVGYDAQPATTTTPVSNTLMSCLPADLRAVMQPMTIYTDNTGNSSNTSANVTKSVDYLPLLAEFEVFGARTHANQYEKNNQAQYAYYSAGNSKVKYRHSSTGSSAFWWERSPYYSGSSAFCIVSNTGTAFNSHSRSSRGLAPAFMV